MTRLVTRIKELAFPIYEINNVRYGKLKLRHGKRGFDVRINLKFGSSEWLRAKSDYIWLGETDKKIRLSGTNEDKVEKINKMLKKKTKIKVRIPEMEKRKDVQKEVRKEQNKILKKTKRW